MKKASEVFKSIRFAKGEPRDKPHMSTDDEEHYVVGEKEWNQQVAHAKKMAMQEDVEQILEYGDTAKGQKMLTKVHKRAVNRLIKADDKNMQEPDYTKRDLKTVRKHQATADRAWDRMSEEVVAEDVEQLDELSPETLQSYKDKARDSAEAATAKGDSAKSLKRWSGHMKATGKQIEKTTANIRKALNREEVEQIDELTGKGKLPQIAAYHKQKGDEAKDKMETIRNTNRTLPVPKEKSAKIHSKDAESTYHYTQAKRAKSLMAKEDVEQIEELVKRDVSKDVQTMDKVSFIKKHGVSKSQAKVLAQEGENKQMKKDPCWKGYEMVGMKKKNGKEVPNCVPTNEGVYSERDIEDRENAANPGMRSPRKSGVPFDGPYKKKPSAKPGKYGSGYSTAKHLAKQGLKKAMGEAKEVKLSKKAQIVKNAAKEKFNKDPELSDSVTKNL